MKKKSFLELLKTYTPKEINEIIENKGKKPKLIRPIHYCK